MFTFSISKNIAKKVISKDHLKTEEMKHYARQEAEIHKMVSNHNNVVKLYADRETETEFEFYIEYCDRENYLADKILERTNPVSNTEKLLSYSHDILQGLDYIH